VESSSILPLTLAIAAGLIFSAQARGQSSTNNINSYGTGNRNGSSSDPFATAPGMGTSGRAAKQGSSDNSDTNSDSDVDDPTLYRMRTSEGVGSGEMTRDDGELTRKPRRREKVSKVESTKHLPTTGTDSKFQGSLIDSSVPSISAVGEKSHVDLQTKGQANAKGESETLTKDEGEARFKARQLMLSAEEPANKKDSTQTKAESSPSPSASPSRSASPSSR
jgi:hypothetical protein